MEEKKGTGRRKLLLIICVAAAVLAAGLAVFLLVVNQSSATADDDILIYTKDGGLYLNGKDGKLVGKSEEIIAIGKDSAVFRRDGLYYYVWSGKETQIGGTRAKVLRANLGERPWALWKDASENTFLFRPGKGEDIPIFEKTNVGTIRENPGGRYLTLASSGIGPDHLTVLRVDLVSGEVRTLYEEKGKAYLGYADETGAAYIYTSIDTGSRQWYVADGESALLEGVDQLEAFGGILLTGKSDRDGGKHSWYTRSPGRDGSLTPLSGAIDEDLLENVASGKVLSFSQTGADGFYRSTGSTFDSDLHDLLVKNGDDWFFIDLKEKTAECFLKGTGDAELKNVQLAGDLRSGYAVSGSTLYRLSRGKTGWEQEQIAENCTFYAAQKAGIVYTADQSSYVYDGKKSVRIADGGGIVSWSRDLKHFVYTEQETGLMMRLMYVSAPGKDAECIYEGLNLYGFAAIRNGYVYYVNRENVLVRVKPGRKEETVLENVNTIYTALLFEFLLWG